MEFIKRPHPLGLRLRTGFLVLEALSRGLKRAGHEADHSTLYSAEFMNECLHSYLSLQEFGLTEKSHEEPHDGWSSGRDSNPGFLENEISLVPNRP
jgi:hypothetical protein